MAHYMELFQSPEEYIIHRIGLNMGTHSCIAKTRLLQLARENGIYIDPDTDKVKIAQIVMRRIGAEALAKECRSMGVSSYNFQQKFGITRDDVAKLASMGFLQVTGTEQYGESGHRRYASLYNVFQYFQLTPTEVQKQLKQAKEGKQTASESA